MSGIWLASYIALWAVVLFQGVVIFVLLRQLGVIYLGTAQGVANDGLDVGHAAPDFSLRQIDGQKISLASFQTRPLILIFGSPTCAPCRDLIPDLNLFARERAAEVGVLFLSRGDEESARRLAEELNIDVPVASHPDEQLPEAFDLPGNLPADLLAQPGPFYRTCGLIEQPKADEAAIEMTLVID